MLQNSQEPATLLEKRLWHKCFPVNFANFINTFFYRTSPVADSEFSSSKVSNNLSRLFVDIERQVISKFLKKEEV